MTKKNRFLSIFLCLALMMTIIPMSYINASALVQQSNFSGGDGTESNPYKIATEQDLKDLATDVNNGIDYNSIFFIQTEDIRVTDFVPIGWVDDTDKENPITYYFDGTYDGNNKEISGTIGDETKYNQALFIAVFQNGTVKNVINNATVKGDIFVGGIAAMNMGKINNCQNNGNISAFEYVGGIVVINMGEINNCQNNGNISGDTYDDGKECSIGGIVAINQGTILYCKNSGEVYSILMAVGGICGKNEMEIIRCINEGDVTGTGYSVGGVAGYSSGSIQNSSSAGNVEGAKNIGGLVGANYGSVDLCYSTGDVTGTDNNIGGFAGYNNSIGSEIHNSYSAGEVTGPSDFTSPFAYNLTGTISNCFYNSDICTKNEAFATGKTTEEMTSKDFVNLLTDNGNLYGFSYKKGLTGSYYPYITVFGASSATKAESKTQTFFTGEGNEENPYLITSKADLEKLRDVIYQGFDTTDIYFKQTADITVENFVPIKGSTENNWEDYVNFCGIYDGDNYQINGSIGDETKYSQALFFELGEDALVKNLNMNATVKGLNSVGSIVVFNYGTILNCSNSGDIISTGDSVGGIAAVIDPNSGTVDGCHNSGDVKGGIYVGGLVGTNQSLTTVKNSYNTGNITGDRYVGGIVGDNRYGRIYNCYNLGKVTATYEFLGGITGINENGEVSYCYNAGEVELTNNSPAHTTTAGLVGWNSGGKISNSFNIGSIISCKSWCSVIVGFNMQNGDLPAGIIENCYYNKDIYTDRVSRGEIGKTTAEMSTEEFVKALNNGGNEFKYVKNLKAENYPFLASFGKDSAVVSKEKTKYPVLEGDNQTLTGGTNGTLTFRVDSDFEKFVDLYLDDVLVEKSNYTAKSGSTIITLKAEYVKNLSVGEKEFTLEFKDGYSVVNMEVEAPVVVTPPSTDGNTDTENPKTSESSNMIFLTLFGLIALATIGTISYKKKSIK